MKKSGKFCKANSQLRYKNVTKALQKRWSAKSQDTTDAVNQDSAQTIDIISQDCEQHIDTTNNKTVDAIKHNHDYLQHSDVLNKSDVCLNIQEEEVTTSALPKNAIPIDSYRLVIELGHIITELKRGCTQCKIPLNICNAQGVLPKGLGGCIYIKCDDPSCSAMNKISLGKQHKNLYQTRGISLISSHVDMQF